MEDGVTSKISADDDGAITLTDGSITYKRGDASHLSTAEKLLTRLLMDHLKLMQKHVLTASMVFRSVSSRSVL